MHRTSVHISKCFMCLFYASCSETSSASNPVEERARNLVIWDGFIVVEIMFYEDCFISTSKDGDVSFKLDISHLCMIE